MTHSLKGALLSGLVFPGIGQIVLKHYTRGVVLLLVVSACMVGFIVKAVHQAYAVLGKISSAGGEVDMNIISNTAAQASSTAGDITMKLLFAVTLFFWIFAAVDAYLLGRKKDMESRQAREALLWKEVDRISKGSS